MRHRAGGGADGRWVCECVRGTASLIPHPELHRPTLLTTASRQPLPFAPGRSLHAARPVSPGEGEVHEADDGEAEQGDGVRPVEEVDGDVLHLLLVDHPEMHLVVHIIFAQGPAPHAGRHGPPPRPAAAAAVPARGGWDPGGDEPLRASGRTAGPGLAPSTGWKPREGPAREGGVAAPPTRPRAEGGRRRPCRRGSSGSRISADSRCLHIPGGRGLREAAWGRREAVTPGRLPPLRTPPALPPRCLADGLAHSGRSPRGRGSAAARAGARETLRDCRPGPAGPDQLGSHPQTNRERGPRHR